MQGLGLKTAGLDLNKEDLQGKRALPRASVLGSGLIYKKEKTDNQASWHKAISS